MSDQLSSCHREQPGALNKPSLLVSLTETRSYLQSCRIALADLDADDACEVAQVIMAFFVLNLTLTLRTCWKHGLRIPKTLSSIAIPTWI